MKLGYVYFITNPSLREGLYKIGFTDNLAERINTFNHETSCPTPWKVIATIETEKYKELEHHLHHIYAAQRVNPKREFFDFKGDEAVEDVLDMLQECATIIGGQYVADESYLESTADSDEKKRKFSFKLINIPAGSKVTFQCDDPTVPPSDYYVAANQRAVVEDPNDINDKSKYETLSSLVQELLHRPGVWSSRPDCWFYNGKSCGQIRKEMGV